MTHEAIEHFAGRVLYIARAPFVSGAERALMTLLRHLDRARVEPHLVLGQETDLLRQAGGLGVPVTIIPLAKRQKSQWIFWRRSCKKLKRLMREIGPAAVHANDVPSGQAMSVVAGGLGVPRVMHVRWTITSAAACWWARDGAEAVVCISEWVRGQLGQTKGTALETAMVEVIPDAVDWPAEEGVPDAKPQAAGAKPQAAGAKPPAAGLREQRVLGFSGQLIESKGLDLVIEAMGMMPAAKRPRLLVAGEDTQTRGAYQATLQALAERVGVAGCVEWLGFLDDVTTLHRRVHAMVCPSREEPLGLVPLEAARFGVATVANRVGGLAETILDGQTGYLVEPTADAWAAALARLADAAPDALARLGRAAHERTRTLYSPMAYQQKLMALYARIAHPQNAALRAAAKRGPRPLISDP